MKNGQIIAIEEALEALKLMAKVFSEITFRNRWEIRTKASYFDTNTIQREGDRDR